MLSKHKIVENNRYKKAIKEAINDDKESRTIVTLRRAGILVLLILLGISTTEFIVTNQQFDKVAKNLALIEAAFNRVSQVQNVGFVIRELLMMSDKIFEYDDHEWEHLKEDIAEGIEQLDEAQTFLSESDVEMSEEHFRLVEDEVTKLHF